MNEVMYGLNSFLIVAALFAALLVAIEVGHRLGIRAADGATDASKAQINTIQASLLGVLALLLGFTFSLSLQRYDSRSQAVVNEANAIGTAMLRSDLLPPEVQERAQRMLREYLDLRIEASAIPLHLVEERDAVLVMTSQNFDSLWQQAVRAAARDDAPRWMNLYIQSLNELIDAYGIRDAALDRHVPELVLFLLFGTFILTASLVGYASGMSAKRASFATYILVLLIVSLVFIIIDLDRPRRGLIAVSQQSLLDLQAANRDDRR